MYPLMSAVRANLHGASCTIGASSATSSATLAQLECHLLRRTFAQVSPTFFYDGVTDGTTSVITANNEKRERERASVNQTLSEQSEPTPPAKASVGRKSQTPSPMTSERNPKLHRPVRFCRTNLLLHSVERESKNKRLG